MYALGTDNEIKAGIEAALSAESGDRYIRYGTGTSFEAVKQRLENCDFVGKWLRPWDCVAPSTVLDADKVWVGVEMETGYEVEDDRYEAIQWFNETVKRGCYDEEGPEYGVEFTFYPTHLEDMETNPFVVGLIDRAKHYPPVEHDADEDEVGTHINISTPKSRKNKDALGYVSTIYEEMDEYLGYDDRWILFGRGDLYQYEVNFMTEGYWEFKWFNTTYSPRQWKVYCLVARKLAGIIQELEENPIRDCILATEYFFTELASLLPEARDILAGRHTQQLSLELTRKAA